MLLTSQTTRLVLELSSPLNPSRSGPASSIPRQRKSCFPCPHHLLIINQGGAYLKTVQPFFLMTMTIIPSNHLRKPNMTFTTSLLRQASSRKPVLKLCLGPRGKRKSMICPTLVEGVNISNLACQICPAMSPTRIRMQTKSIPGYNRRGPQPLLHHHLPPWWMHISNSTRICLTMNLKLQS